MKFLFLLTMALALTTSLKAQEKIPLAVQWLTFDQALELNAKQDTLPIMIYLGDNKNDSSRLMLTKSFSGREIASYINRKFRPVQFDIRSANPVKYLDGKIYEHKKGKPYHDLAYTLLGQNVKAPALLFFNKQNKGFAFSGFRHDYEILCYLVYFSENVNLTTPINVWIPAYFRTFPPDKKANNLPLALHWMGLKEALKANHTQPKGLLITTYIKGNASSSVMLANAFSHKNVVEYLNDNFYCVRLDANTDDTLVWDKQYFGNHAPGRYHELVEKLMNHNPNFPGIFFFNQYNYLIFPSFGYLSPEAIFLIANYVKTGAYENTEFPDYTRNFKFDWQDIAPTQKIKPDNKN